MAEQFYPFDNSTVATELQWSRMMRILMPDGIDTKPTDTGGGSLRVTGTGLTLNVGFGNAWIRGFYYSSDAAQTVALPPNTSTNPRIDVVTLRVNTSANTIGVTFIQGTPAVTPVAPAIVKSEATGIYDLPLAHCRVNPDDTVVVTDKRRFVGRPSVWCTSDNRPDPENRPLIAFELDTERVIFTIGDGVWQVGLGDTLYRPIYVYSGDAGTTTASTAWDSTLNDTGASTLAASFTAPPSGRARISWGAYLANNTSNGTTYMALRLVAADGAVIWGTWNQSGSGASLVPADADRKLSLNSPGGTGTGGVGASCAGVNIATNLVPGTRYTATLMYLVNAGSGSTGTWDNRYIDIQPLP